MVLLLFDPCVCVDFLMKCLWIVDVWCKIYMLICSILISGTFEIFWKSMDEDLHVFILFSSYLRILPWNAYVFLRILLPVHPTYLRIPFSMHARVLGFRMKRCRFSLGALQFKCELTSIPGQRFYSNAMLIFQFPSYFISMLHMSFFYFFFILQNSYLIE